MTDIEKNENIVELDDEALDEVSGGKKKSSPKFLKLTGNVNIRKAPSLDGAIITSLSEGTVISYLGSSKKDKRGVAWYKVNCNGSVGWVSSKYAKFM